MEVCEHWIRDYGVDGWRLDVANEVDRTFWRAFRQRSRAINPESVMIGEIWESSETWLQGDMFDSTMNYDFRKNCRDFFGTEAINATEFNARVTKMNYRYPTGILQGQLNLLDSHDVNRFFSYCQKDIRDCGWQRYFSSRHRVRPVYSMGMNLEWTVTTKKRFAAPCHGMLPSMMNVNFSAHW